MGEVEISAMDWAKGVLISILASIIGGISKLAIRKSWLLQAKMNDNNRRVGYEQRTLSVEGNFLRTEAPGDITNEDEVWRGDGEQLFDDQRKNSNLVPYALRYSGMFGMSVFNPICCVLAMNYASPSILAPFSGLTLVWVILFSPLVNNEKPSSRQIFACCLIISGEVIVAIFGDHTNDEDVTVEDVKTSYKKPAFIFYFCGLISYLILMAYWINYSQSSTLQRFAWGCSGGALTGAQNFLKDSLTIIKARDAEHNLSLVFYPLSFMAAITAFVGLLFLTVCMKRYDATYSAASFVGSFVVSASVMAAVHYNTFAEINGVLNSVLYPSGIFVLMVGVYLLVRDNSESRQGNDSTDQQRQLDSNNNDEVDFNLEDMFGYTEVEDEAREETLLGTT